MSIKLTSAETGRNKSTISAAVGTSNKIAIAPYTSTFIKNNGISNVSVGYVDTSDTSLVGQSVTVDAVYVTDSNFNILDDTALSSAGGFLKIIGTGFKSGAVAYIQGVPATSTVVTSSTELRVTTPALTSGTLQVYVVNPDNTVGIRISGIIVSGVPSWTTTSPLPDQPLDIAFSLQLTAVSDSTVAYSLQNGSSLPSGVSLNSSGVLSGTVTGLLVDTTYSFTLVATDLELQDTAKVFSVTISFGDAYFKQSTLVITGEANSTPWIVDGSNTNKTLTIGGDTRPSAFSPYNNNWSVYFDGTGDYLSNASGNIIDFGTGDFTVEYWWYPTAAQTAATNIHVGGATTSAGLAFGYAANGNLTANTSGAGYTSTVPASLNQWQHIAWTRQSGSLKLYKNGVLGYTTTVNTNLNETGCGIYGTKNGTFVGTAGYMSNVRVVKGTVVYTENFTPPTSPLTATQSANTNGIPSAAISSGTTLLALQSNRYIDKATANSGSGFSLTKNGEPLIKSFAPFTETDLISGSAYFDGNGDSIIIPDNPNLELGSGDFCVECWIYPTDVGSTAIIIDKRSGTYGPLLLWRSTNIVQLYMSASGSAWNLVNGSTVGIIETNQWYHIAVYRVGSSIYTAFNGVVTLQNASGGAAPQDNSGNWGIGTQPDGTTNPFTGYIADMRFVIGSGVYASTNFTPPSTSLTNVTNTKLLTLQTRIGENNQRFIDEGGAKALITRFGNATQGAFTPYSPSGWSAYFDGSGDYLTVADNASLELGSSNFCIEMLIFTTAVSTDAILITKRASSVAYAPILIYRNSAAIRVGMSSNGSSWDIVDPTTTTLGTVNTNQWYHISVYRIGTAIYGSLNGTITTLNPNTSATALNNTDPYYIGSDSNLSPYVGYISNLRVVIGSSVYSNTSAPSPTSSLTAVANTVLLTCQDNRFRDNSTANSGVGFTVTRVGDTKIEAFNPFRPNEPYSPTTHGGSAYFDGTGDYLTVASDTITTLGTQDFTIEFWTYVTTLATQITLIDQRTGGSEIVPWITANATTTVFGTATTNRISGSPLTTNQWNHIAVSRFSGNTRLFINGTQSGSTYVDGFTYVSGAIYIGSSYVSSQRVNGYISDFNISKTGKYTTSFTVPNTRITSTGNTLSRLEFDNAGIIDYTCKNAIETIGTVRVSTANSKYGTSSVSFNTKTDALALPVSRLNSTFLGDFTIECYVYPTDATITHWGIYDARQSGGTSDAFALSLEPLASPVSGSYRMSYYNAGYSYGTGTVLSNVWTHLAWVRSGTTLTFYVDGVAGGTVSVSGTLTGAATTNPIWIGIKDNATAAYGNIGYIDDLRITNGYARYTGNFTPPTLIPTE
jgi:hypothetical protein